MKYVIIRDDDVSFFTKPELLEKLYGRYFEKNKSISFAVIPKITSEIRTDLNNPYKKFEQLDFDPIVPPKYRGIKDTYRMDENSDLINYLSKNPCCEILQHGLSHGYINSVKEFRIREKEILKQRAEEGSKILNNCFYKKPDFFVAPWDNLSFEAIDIIKSAYKGLSLGRINPLRFPAKCWGAYLNKLFKSKKYLFYEKLLITEHSGFILSRFNNPKNIFNQVKTAIDHQNVTTLVNHHWEYFYDWNTLNVPFFNAWSQVSDYILENENLEIITFSELYNLLEAKKI